MLSETPFVTLYHLPQSKGEQNKNMPNIGNSFHLETKPTSTYSEKLKKLRGNF